MHPEVVGDGSGRRAAASPADWPFWEYKMNALLTAEADSGGAERRQTVAHGGFPGASRKKPRRGESESGTRCVIP